MTNQPVLQPIRLLPSGFIDDATPTMPSGETEVSYPVGWPGSCTGGHRLFQFVLDDSASLTGTGGWDPLSRRYAEIRHCVRSLARACTCGRERVAVHHFDRSQLDLEPTPLREADRIVGGLREPNDVAGTSELLPVLRRAKFTHSAHTIWRKAETFLLLASDFLITDRFSDRAFDRLTAFPGSVTAVALGTEPDPRLDHPRIRVVTIDHTDPPGKLARALFETITSGRAHRHLAEEPRGRP